MDFPDELSIHVTADSNTYANENANLYQREDKMKRPNILKTVIRHLDLLILIMFDLSDYQIVDFNDVRFIRLDTLIVMMFDLFYYQILDSNDVRFI